MFRKAVGLIAAFLLLAALTACGPSAPDTVQSPEENEALPDNPVPSEEIESTSLDASTPSPDAAAPGFDESALDDMPHKEEYLRLHRANDQVCAWVTVPNTKIDYAAALGTDNDYYLSHTLEGEDSKSGAIFFDYRTDETFSGRHLILYGHNMKAGTMFHDLGSYKYRDFFENNRVITLWVGSEKRQYEVYAAFIAPQDVYFIRVKFEDDAHFLDYMDGLRQHSKFSTDAVLLPTDQILTLSTCTYEEKNARFVVQARRIS